jgi:ABC-2 type transport system ATP-binding protein
MPKPGANVLSAVGAMIAKYDWDVPELHLESGRLDEVFRSLTEPNGVRAGIDQSSAASFSV